MLKFFPILFALNPLTSCSPVVHPPEPRPAVTPALQEQAFVGTWIEVLPGSDGDSYVFTATGQVENGAGNAQRYTGWRLENGRLVLTLETPGAGRKDQPYIVEKITPDALRIRPEGSDWARVFRAG